MGADGAYDEVPRCRRALQICPTTLVSSPSTMVKVWDRWYPAAPPGIAELWVEMLSCAVCARHRGARAPGSTRVDPGAGQPAGNPTIAGAKDGNAIPAPGAAVPIEPCALPRRVAQYHCLPVQL